MSKELKIIVGLLAIFIVIMNVSFAPNNVLSWDVFGYYLYLPLTFIYHDLGLQNDEVILQLIEKYRSTGTFYQVVRMPEGTHVMKYSMGMAFLYAPFFFVGWLGALVFDYPVDGFSLPFQYSIFAGGIVYTLVGLWFLAKVLSKFFSWKISTIVLLIIVFGTNYLAHITLYGQNAMSQNYLFTAYALILWFTIQWHEKHKIKDAIALGVILGLSILSRPTEIVALAIPILWGVYSKDTLVSKWKELWKYKTHVITLGLLIGFFGFLQLGYWKWYSGKFLFNSYGANAGEGLDLLNPHTYKFLFSYRKGWLLFTPIMVGAIAGFYGVYKRKKEIFWALLAYFIFNLYLVSSWTTWWYAQSFSQRAMVSSYPIMAIGLGYLLVWFSKQQKGLRIGFVLLGMILVSFNLFQTLQFHKGVLHGDRMTKEYYYAVFGKLSVTPEDKKLLLIDRGFDGSERFTNETEYDGRVLDFLTFDDGNGEVSKEYSYSGCCSVELNLENEFSPYVETSFSELTSSDHAWVRITANVYPTENDLENPFSIVGHFSYNGFPYKYRTVNATDFDLIPNQWNKVQMDYLTPEVRTKNDKFRTLIWYRGNKKVYVDDLKVEVFVKK